MSDASDFPVDTLRRWREHPEQMVRELFKVTPDPWQDEVLASFPRTPRVAMKASKGPGKTATLSWLGWNFLLTRLHPNIGATSISGDNLRDGLWKEMSFWREQAPTLKAEFEITSERIFRRKYPNTWFMSARTWPKAASAEQLGNTLAGLHAENVLYLIDEAGSIPVAILAAAEAALANVVGANEAHIVMAGNTNSLEGALYQGCVRQAHLWHVVPISGDPDDPKRSTRISLSWAKEMVASYGRESPFVKVMILGEWPAQSVNALLSANDVEEAMKRKYQKHDIERRARVLGVDVARHGLAKSVIFPRQGLVAFRPVRLRNATGNEGAGHISRIMQDEGVDAVFVDNTGGFGASWIDALAVLNRTAIGIQFSERAEDPIRYVNRRAEMYFRLANWITKEGGALPPDVPELMVELPAMTYTFQKDRLMLEPKELVEAAIGYSPDDSDALALTHATTVAPRPQEAHFPQRDRETVGGRYDPFKRFFG